MVSLPKEWASEIYLETGDTLRLFPCDRTVLIEPAADDDGHWETTVEIDRLRRSVATTVEEKTLDFPEDEEHTYEISSYRQDVVIDAFAEDQFETARFQRNDGKEFVPTADELRRLSSYLGLNF